MTQLKTAQDPMNLLSPTNLTNVTISNLSDDGPTTTAPTNTGNSAVIPTSSLNYIKIVPMFSALSTGQVMRVTGYSKSSVGSFFVPQLLYFGTVTAVNTTYTATSINSQNMFSVATHAKTEGDAKVYTATSSQSTAFLLIDTVGCSLIKIDFAATAASGSANAFIGFI
jgi:hypothetical protein